MMLIGIFGSILSPLVTDHMDENRFTRSKKEIIHLYDLRKMTEIEERHNENIRLHGD